MNYEDIKLGGRVIITAKNPKRVEAGTVVDKQLVYISGEPYERVWIDTDRGGRRICVPAVLIEEET